ncbi:peroxiredoxin [Anseongella ginsenosidimutans]|uniref:Peroxiredoxin n=1 Tax=Anseongella ginsenosidimutans TaxID=496056 RepID=A0A4R3KVZ0_9SPHI|nr:TlpA disulfide reductase family protein [Anseongella ginsenosidimutans]QEC51399.1 TlpA family protein disulfide reductase [Anseongella ginsenosidimutans]TCS89897.1 peroxiredoxin [Anseongella ginsenosidimutans]
MIQIKKTPVLRNILVPLFAGLMFMTSCSQPSGSGEGLREGIWRATLTTESGAKIPFNFEVKSDSTALYIEIINGESRLKADEITVTADSIHFLMPFFDSEFKARRQGDSLSGSWIKHLAGRDAVMPFHAVQGASYRFLESPEPPLADISGRWATDFVREGDTTIAVGEFRQEGNRLTGTFITPYGDYRFLEGTISGNEVFLSSFDGGYATLFTAAASGDSVLSGGKFYSGRSGIKDWRARKDSTARLPDANSLTYLEEGFDQLDFTYVNLEGDSVSLSDEKFRGKVVVIQFFGSWCPNCMDETRFLSDFYKEYHDKGFEVVGLAYERTTDMEKNKRLVRRMTDRFGVEYEMLLTGYTNQQVEESMPALRNFMAFPTTIILDREGNVRRVHTGFNGPGTGAHYEVYVEEFTRMINELLNE